MVSGDWGTLVSGDRVTLLPSVMSRAAEKKHCVLETGIPAFGTCFEKRVLPLDFRVIAVLPRAFDDHFFLMCHCFNSIHVLTGISF